MRIVIDLQGAQSLGSRTRGIGRYTMALARAIVRNSKDHEIFLVLNGLFPETIEPIRAAFEGLLPQENIRVWHAPGPVAFHKSDNHWRKGAAERVREAFLASIRPDVVLVSSLLEGYEDDAVTSVGILSKTIPTAVILYDLIPYIYPSPYLDNPSVNNWYREKIEHLCHCDLWLSISESSRQEGIEYLNLPGDRIVNISTDADACFQPLKISDEEEASVRAEYGLNHPFIMYTGGIDHRKNIEGLIRAFAKLPKKLRETHQVAIVCSAQPEIRQHLEYVAEKQGISKNSLIITGFVPEDHLLALYNLCSLFVFPSWHEGFGLPALEAMRCGAPVIGANTSSLPEVIGWQDALFDPRSDDEIATVMERALSDEKFRNALIKNGKARSEKFSWDRSALRAIEEMERLHSIRHHTPANDLDKKARPKLAYISPLPPERSGIADYSAELLPELSSHYEIDVIVAQEHISDAWISKNCQARSVEWFVDHSDDYDRVLYHFGNSPYHQHMFNLLKTVPGVVVLHDFYLSALVAHMDFYGASPNLLAQELYRSHGYRALYDLFHCKESAEVTWQYPCSLSVIQNSLGIIVHSEKSCSLTGQWFGDEVDDWAVIPLLKDSRIEENRARARQKLGFSADDFVVCTFGMLGPTKLNKELLTAWINSKLAADQACHLVFVGENHGGDYGHELLTTIHNSKYKSRVHLTGWTQMESFRQYLAAADVGVQLRSQSRGETSAAVLDCMNYGLPTIVNANGSMAELDADVVLKLPDKFSNEELVGALDALYQNRSLRQRMGEAARREIVEQHDPRSCAKLYQTEIERFYRSAIADPLVVLHSIASSTYRMPEDIDLITLAKTMAFNFPPRNRKHELLVDISVLVQHDAKTGIQRVVRSILWEWLRSPPAEYRIEPIYASSDHNYRYARSFTAKFLGLPENPLCDEPVDFIPGDIILGLDLQLHSIVEKREFYQTLRQRGVQVYFIVYDLLPNLLPEFFIPDVAAMYQSWLEIVTESDGAICISKSVSNELKMWLDDNNPQRLRKLKVDWFHLGGDIDNLHSSTGSPSKLPSFGKQLTSRPSFLMVGTLEPRKGHKQVLDAFEQLWECDINVNLVIVGKQGWAVESLVQRIKFFSEHDERLFWLEGISDEYLEKVYAASDCLIAASYGEGFGLPLIEAAQHKIPIIARDIPVFREVAGDHAYYFDSEDPDDLADAIKHWLELFEKGEQPTSDDMPWLTWKESAEQLLSVLIDDNEQTAKPSTDAISETESELGHQGRIAEAPEKTF